MVRESEWSFKSLLSSWTEIYPKNNCSLIISQNIVAKSNNSFQTNSCSRFDSDDIFHQLPRHKSHAQSLERLPIRLPTLISHAIVWTIDFPKLIPFDIFCRPWIKYPTLLLSQEGRQQNSLFARPMWTAWQELSDAAFQKNKLIVIFSSWSKNPSLLLPKMNILLSMDRN